MRVAVDAHETNRGRNGRLRFPRPAALQRRERFQRALVLQLPKRNHGVDLQRSTEPRDLQERFQRIRRVIVAERLDHGAPEVVLAPAHLLQQRFTHARIAALGRECAHERRSHKFAVFAIERLQQHGSHLAGRMMLVVAVGHRAQPIVRIAHDPAHDGRRARIVEARQQHQGTEADVSVVMALDSLNQRRRHRIGRCAPQGASRIHARVEGGAARRRIHVPERVDGRLNRLRRERLRAALLRSRGGGRRLGADHSRAQQSGECKRERGRRDTCVRF